MCLMCEQEAFYQAYLDYVAAEQAKAAKAGQGATPAAAASGFSADAVEETADDTAVPVSPKT